VQQLRSFSALSRLPAHGACGRRALETRCEGMDYYGWQAGLAPQMPRGRWMAATTCSAPPAAGQSSVPPSAGGPRKGPWRLCRIRAPAAWPHGYALLPSAAVRLTDPPQEGWAAGEDQAAGSEAKKLTLGKKPLGARPAAIPFRENRQFFSIPARLLHHHDFIRVDLALLPPPIRSLHLGVLRPSVRDAVASPLMSV
jgi:hypothetical protein